MKTKRKKLAPRGPKRVYMLIDKDGNAVIHHGTPEDAHMDAWGPIFRPYRVVEYTRGKTVKAKP